MAMIFVIHAQYELHVPNIIMNLNFDGLTVAALAPPNYGCP